MVERSVVMRAGLVKRLHVDQRRIRANLKEGSDAPPITIQARGGPYKAHEVRIEGPSSLVYDEGGCRQLACGARLWIETISEVQAIVRSSVTPEV